MILIFLLLTILAAIIVYYGLSMAIALIILLIRVIRIACGKTTLKEFRIKDEQTKHARIERRKRHLLKDWIESGLLSDSQNSKSQPF